MSALKAEALVREFQYKGIRIPDPSPDLSVEQVRDLLTPNYPEVATASVSGPDASSSEALGGEVRCRAPFRLVPRDATAFQVSDLSL